MTRHVLGVLGVSAASVLLAVSAMMNYQFGYSLGRTPSDGHIYGLASAAADCFKALVPFFFFAAWRNRMWSQALAAVLVWFVVTGYSMTSALGHAALNRSDTAGKRTLESTSYKDLRADKKRYEEQLSWLPKHRAVAAVKAEMEALKAQRWWTITGECQETAGKTTREFCAGYHKLDAELGNALEAVKLNTKIEETSVKLAKVTGATVMAEADPQATVLSKMTGVEVETIQTALTLFVALLIEIGSGFGMYVAFAYWRTYPPSAPAAPAAPVVQQVAVRHDAIWSDGAPAAEPSAVEPNAAAAPATEPPIVRSPGDNDNEVPGRIMPPNDVQRFYQDYVVTAPPTRCVNSSHLNEAYRLWCKKNDRHPLPMPNFTADFDELKAADKHDIGGRVKYSGIALRPEVERELEKRASRRRKASPASEQAPEQAAEAPAEQSKAA